MDNHKCHVKNVRYYMTHEDKSVWILSFLKNLTGSKRTSQSLSCPLTSHKHIKSHPRTTLTRATTCARAFAPGDHLTQKPVIITKPRTFVSMTELWKFWVFTSQLFCLTYIFCLVLKRRILLSISGCIFFGIIFVFLGCIILRFTRKPGLVYSSLLS